MLIALLMHVLSRLAFSSIKAVPGSSDGPQEPPDASGGLPGPLWGPLEAYILAFAGKDALKRSRECRKIYYNQLLKCYLGPFLYLYIFS